MNKKFSALSLSTLLLATSCFGGNKNYYPLKQCNNQDSTHTMYQKCDLTDVKEYYDVIVDNSKKSNKVVLWVLGGPLKSSYGKLIKDGLAGKEVPQYFSFYIDFFKEFQKSDTSIYLVNQSQYLKQKKYLDGNIEKLTYEDGYKEHMETVDSTQNIIKHLKSEGKKVGLAGGSYGSFVVNEYLAKYGDDTPDWVLSYAGRLKIGNAAKIKAAYKVAEEKQHGYIFIKDNDEVDDSYNKKDMPKPKNPNGIIVQFKIGINGLTKDYTKVIKDQDLSNTYFVTANPDFRVGWYNQEEINWARSRKASVTVYSKTESKREYDKMFPIKKDEKLEQREFNLGNFAHQVTLWNKDYIKKHYFDPFNK